LKSVYVLVIEAAQFHLHPGWSIWFTILVELRKQMCGRSPLRACRNLEQQRILTII